MPRYRPKKVYFPAVRPSLPITCSAALTLMIGVLFASSIPDLSTMQFPLILVGITSIVVLLLFVVVFRTYTTALIWILIFLVAGILLGSFQLLHLEQIRKAAPMTYEEYEFVIEEDSKTSSYGSKSIGRVESGSFKGEKVQLFFTNEQKYLVGQRFSARTMLSEPGEEFKSFYNDKGIAFSANIGDLERVEEKSLSGFFSELRERMLAILGCGSEEQILLRAILLGERSELFDAGFYHDIKVVGLAHFVAVSGAHLVIVTGFITLLLRCLHLRARYSVAIQAIFLVVYLALVGFPLSCIRAAIMSIITLFALLAKRRASAMSALGLTTMIMTVFDPSVVHQLSFQLSVASTFGIVLFMPLLDGWFVKLFPKLPEFIRETLSMTLSALVFSLPLSASQFSTIPLVSPLANVVATPYLTMLLIAGFSSILLSSAIPASLALLKILTGGLLFILSLIAKVPGASLPVSWDVQISLFVTSILAVSIWFWWPTPRAPTRATFFGIGACCIVLIVAIFGVKSLPADDRVVMLNVGQGDSFALVSDKRTVLIDTGNQNEMLNSALARNGIDHIDAVLITHPDDDHCGSLESLQGVVEVDKVIVARGLIGNEADNARSFVSCAKRVVGDDGISEVSAGDIIRFRKFTLEIVSPESIENDGGNEDSICLYANYDGDNDGKQDWSGFFCGDAEVEVLVNLNEQGKLHRVDLYKVGHHGSKKSITQELASILEPKVALIGVGKNSYGHPREEIINYLEAENTSVHRSDVCGDCRITLFPDHVQIACEHE